jgi:GNAT superfamily N-acetyltransferase
MISIRRAEAADVERLTELVHTSAAYRGRYASIIAGYRVTPEYVEKAPSWVAADPERSIRGWVSLQLDPLEIDMMFVADEDHGRGIGRALVAHLLDDARRRGPGTARVVAHPDAEGFYRRCGAERVGTVPPTPPRITWARPELRFVLSTK